MGKDLTSTLLFFVFCMSSSFLDPHFLNYCLCLCFVDFFVVTCFDSFLISSCVYSIDIFFVVTMGVTYNILKLKQSNLNDTNLTSVAYKSSIPIQLCPPPFVVDVTNDIYMRCAAPNIDSCFFNFIENKKWSYKTNLQ